jgi:phytoene dehydrogenase-like protein
MTDGGQSEGLPDANRTGRRRSTAVVVGGGLAGITAALSLADAGVHVTLLEGRPRLGGLAFSFQRGDLTVDNGQHVYLRCCTAYRWFLDRVDGAALAPLQDRLDVPVLDADGRLCAWANTVDWQRLPRHPDTGFVFDGATVAGYAAAARACVALHERLPQFGFIGWDVAIDSEGAPQVLEMNIGQPDVKVIEMSVGPSLTALQLERYARRAA